MNGREHIKRYKVLTLAESLLWTPYKWGGDDPSGLDCSGFIVELLKSVGVLPNKGDWTARDLFQRFGLNANDKPSEGDLIFWQTTAGQIVHVEMLYNRELALSIGAAGGGSSTLDEEDAWEHNAYIRVRPYLNRGRPLAGIKNPYKEEE